jgi:hypothetical protein
MCMGGPGLKYSPLASGGSCLHAQCSLKLLLLWWWWWCCCGGGGGVLHCLVEVLIQSQHVCHFRPLDLAAMHLQTP